MNGLHSPVNFSNLRKCPDSVQGSSFVWFRRAKGLNPRVKNPFSAGDTWKVWSPDGGSVAGEHDLMLVARMARLEHTCINKIGFTAFCDWDAFLNLLNKIGTHVQVLLYYGLHEPLPSECSKACFRSNYTFLNVLLTSQHNGGRWVSLLQCFIQAWQDLHNHKKDRTECEVVAQCLDSESTKNTWQFGNHRERIFLNIPSHQRPLSTWW